MAGNSVNLVFAGDASGAQRAARVADDALETVGSSATTASSDLASAGQETSRFEQRIGSLGAGITGMTDAVDAAGAAVQGLVDIQNASRDRAMKLARAQADVEQAMLDGEQAAIDLEQATVDLTQAQADGRQAGIDLKQAQIDLTQAQLDAETAFTAYNDAVKENGANSEEAKQAMIDLNQARLDEGQALEDANQARIDANQSLVDGKQYALDATQAVRDGKDAQLDLNDAMHEANPSGLQQWADKINLITPILSGLVGVVGLVTAAQWAWNAAQLASPTTWIIAAVVALVAVVVLIATKTDWFQRLWKNAWGGIKDAANAVGRWFAGPFKNFFVNTWRSITSAGAAVLGWFKAMPGNVGRALGGLAKTITAPYRSAFNGIASLWNNTVGRLSFTVPGWIPGMGGNSFSVPNIPKFHSGGIVPGVPGQEVMTVLKAGERVSSESSQIGGGDGPILLGSDGSRLGDLLIEIIQMAMTTRNGDPKALGLRVVR